MAGYYDNVGLDQCHRTYEDNLSSASYDYVINKKAWMRGNVDKCSAKSTGGQCSFYGPMTNKRVLQDSFLTGRGQVLTECPECSVNYLPASVFPPQEARTCQDTQLEPLYTRVPKSCNGLTEVDISQYAALPSNYQRGYNGYDSVVGAHLQGREMARQQYKAVHLDDHSASQNYGSYNMSCGC